MRNKSVYSCIKEIVGLLAVLPEEVTKLIKPELKYHDITYCCINGGQKYRAKGVEKRKFTCILIIINYDNFFQVLCLVHLHKIVQQGFL
jgi:hypothetical protein